MFAELAMAILAACAGDGFHSYMAFIYFILIGAGYVFYMWMLERLHIKLEDAKAELAKELAELDKNTKVKAL